MANDLDLLAGYAPQSGVLAGSVSAIQMPTISCRMVRFKARSTNAGSVYIGISGVTVPSSSTNTTGGMELDAGDDTGWLVCSNLNVFYRICDNAGDALTYLAQ